MKAISARTAKPNTAETDKMDRVWHVVTDNVGGTHQVLATDPIDAINKFDQLYKVTESLR